MGMGLLCQSAYLHQFLLLLQAPLQHKSFDIEPLLGHVPPLGMGCLFEAQAAWVELVVVAWVVVA